MATQKTTIVEGVLPVVIYAVHTSVLVFACTLTVRK